MIQFLLKEADMYVRFVSIHKMIASQNGRIIRKEASFTFWTITAEINGEIMIYSAKTIQEIDHDR